MSRLFMNFTSTAGVLLRYSESWLVALHALATLQRVLATWGADPLTVHHAGPPGALPIVIDVRAQPRNATASSVAHVVEP